MRNVILPAKLQLIFDLCKAKSFLYLHISQKTCIFAGKMQPGNTLYRIGAYLRHYLTAWNTGGEGIHSPYLFYLVRMLMYDANAYYCFAPIEKRRRAMLHTDQAIEITDFGTGATNKGTVYQRTIADIARTSLESPRVGQLLFKWIAYIGHTAQRPLEIVELGASLGITTAYLAAADSRNHITTFEGSPAVADIARHNWSKLNLNNIQLIMGNINDTLHNYVRESIDIAYIDANHTEEATLQYFEYLAPMANEKSIFIIDDIHHSPQMHRAWLQICHHPQVTSTMDIWSSGIVFFNPHFLHKNYTLRL